MKALFAVFLSLMLSCGLVMFGLILISVWADDRELVKYIITAFLGAMLFGAASVAVTFGREYRR